MNKLLLIALTGFALIALTGAENQEGDINVQSLDAVENRQVRDADPGKESNKKGNKRAKNKKNGVKKQNKKMNKKSGDKKKNKKMNKKSGDKKKIKKSKNNNKKSSRRTKKTEKTKKSKGRKNKKAGKKSTRKNGSQRQAGCPVSDTCVETAVTYMKLLKDKVGNFLKQKSRIERQNSTGDKKSAKKNLFKTALNRLVESSGGNISELSCGSASNGSGADQLKNLSATLMACEVDIQAACDPVNLPQPNMTEVSACETAMTSFSTGVEACRKLTGAEACTCWLDTNLSVNLDLVKTCTLSSVATSMAAGVSACRDAFGKCRKYEDDSGPIMHACSLNPSGLLSKLRSLTENQASMVDLQDKIQSLAIQKRDFNTCDDLFKFVATVLFKLIIENPASRQILPVVASITNSTLTSVNCTAADINTASLLLESLVLIFELYASEIASVQESLLALTGTTASAASIDGADDCVNDHCAPQDLNKPSTRPPVTTTQNVIRTTTKNVIRKRRQVIEDILKKKLI